MGWTDIFNSIPIVGHIKAAVEAATGDTDAARRTAAAATGGLVSTVGAVGGFLVGGPAGAAAGGALGNMVGGQLERKINGQDLDLSAGKLITDAAVGGAAGVVGGGGAGNVAKGLAQGLGKELGKDIIQAGVGSIGKTIAAQTGQQIIKGTIETVSSSKDNKGDSKSHPPKIDDKDPGVDEELVEVITEEQEIKAHDVEEYAKPFQTIYSSKWPDLGSTTNKNANIGDMLFNLMPTVLNMIRHGELFNPPFLGWQTCTEDYSKRRNDGRVQSAMGIIAQNPVSSPTPNLEQWIKGLEEKMFALTGELAKGGEKISRPKKGGKFTPGKGGK